MRANKMVRGTNFTCFHAGPKEGWTEFRLAPPDNPMGLLHGGIYCDLADAAMGYAYAANHPPLAVSMCYLSEQGFLFSLFSEVHHA